MVIFGTSDIRYLRSDTADKRYYYPFSDHINNTLLIAGFVDLAILRLPEVGRTILCNNNSYMNAHRPTRCPLGNRHRTAIIVSRTVI